MNINTLKSETVGLTIFGNKVFYWQLFIGLFLFALFLQLVCFTGLVASDDLIYSSFAQRVAEGRYEPDYHHFAIRYGLILPVGILYGLIGVSEWSTIALPLLASSLSVVFIALIATRLFDVRVGLIAALLLATFPMQIRYATVLVPEPIAACYVLLALLAYVWTEDWAPMVLGMLTGALVGMAYLTKEPALFVIPAILIDAALRRRWRHAFGIAIGVGAIISLEHLYYLAMTGDLLFRPHAMAIHNDYATGGRGYSDFDIASLVKRLFVQYPRLMLVPAKDFGLHSLVALILSAAAIWRFRRDRRAHFLLLWAIVPMLYLNFGTSSISNYIPIPVATRYLSFTYPPLFILSAWLLTDLAANAKWMKRFVLPVMAGVFAVGVAIAVSVRGTGYQAESVAGLRLIAERIKPEGIDSVCFDIQPDPNLKSRWPRTFFILSGGVLLACDSGHNRIIVRADQLGFPYVAAREH